jgi:hypothetical protein
MSNLTIITCLANVSFLSLVAQEPPRTVSADRIASRPPSLEWTEVNSDAAWSPRAGLQVVELRNTFFLMGGRTPINPAVLPVPGASVIWSDVWSSRDLGRSWQPLLPTGAPGHWPPRAYFQVVTKGDAMYVLGGQNFKLIPNPGCAFLPPGVPCDPPLVPASDFFNDVWRSENGQDWRCLTTNAGWHGRAGLSSVVFSNEIYVLGGSFNDDSSIVGGPPTRVYFNDVWKSSDGVNWLAVTTNAPWAPRAGGALVAKGGYIYLIGGEDGFLCDPARPDRCPPYFNDVWRSPDGAAWELVTPAAAWSPRPGHQAVVLANQIYLFGGFGLSTDPTNPFKPSNPRDLWVSSDGANWRLISESPWNATTSEEIKYDFKALAVTGGKGGMPPSIFTFGGDRETFNFADAGNYLRVDNDVWRFSPWLGGGW